MPKLNITVIGTITAVLALLCGIFYQCIPAHAVFLKQLAVNCLGSVLAASPFVMIGGAFILIVNQYGRRS